MLSYYNTSSTSLDYLEFPVFLKLYLTDKGDKIANLYVGGYYSVLVAGEQQTRQVLFFNNTSLMDSTYKTAETDFKGYDFGLAVGFGIPLGKFEISGRYARGFPTVITSNTNDINSMIDKRNRVLSFALGYRIR